MPAIAAALDIPSLNNTELASRVISFLRDKCVLLVLDNFEHLLEGSILLSEFLKQAPQLKILVTSRERLNLQGEWTFELGGLSVPPDGDEGAIAYSALQLFEQHARRIRPGIQLVGPERDAAIQICQRVDGMPLAIELAAAWVNALSCQEINTEIGRGFDFLTTSLRDISSRHKSLRAVFEYSWKRLTPDEQNALSQLAFFQGGFDRQAALKVTGSDLHIISSLISKSLLQRSETGRYNIHEVIRQFSNNYIFNREVLQNRHCDYYLNLLSDSESALFGEDESNRLTDLMSEFGNIHIAWQHALEKKKLPSLNSVLPAFWMAYDIFGWLHEGIEQTGKLIQLLKLAPQFPDQKIILGRALTYHGMFVFRAGDYIKSRDALEESIRILREIGAQRFMSPALIFCGIVVSLMGELTYASELMDEGVVYAINYEDTWFMALGQFDQGFIAGQAGQLDYAYERMQVGLSIWRELKNIRFIAFALNFLSPIAIQLGRLDDAHSYLQESIQLSTRINDRWGLGTAIGRSGLLALLQGDLSTAKSLLENSLEIFNNLGARWDIAWALTQLGKVHNAAGNFIEGKIVLKKAIKLALDVNALPQALEAALEFANCLVSEDKTSSALEIIIHVLKHPASTRFTLQQAEELKKKYERSLPAEFIHDLQVNVDPENTLEAIQRLLD